MLVVSVISSWLVFTLARRLGIGRPFAAGAVILFAFSPVGLFFQRLVLLDNFAVAWALAAFVLAMSPRRRLWAFAGSGACFAACVLSKETALVLLPALLLAAIQNSDHRSRRYGVTLLASFFGLIALSYPLYATLKGELFPGSGHVSLIGEAIVQLFTRKSSGSILDPHRHRYVLAPSRPVVARSRCAALSDRDLASEYSGGRRGLPHPGPPDRAVGIPPVYVRARAPAVRGDHGHRSS
jgi:hypothetical protein